MASQDTENDSITSTVSQYMLYVQYMLNTALLVMYSTDFDLCISGLCVSAGGKKQISERCCYCMFMFLSPLHYNPPPAHTHTHLANWRLTPT